MTEAKAGPAYSFGKGAIGKRIGSFVRVSSGLLSSMVGASKFLMKINSDDRWWRACRAASILGGAIALSAVGGRAQESPQAPMPPPPEHSVRRLSTEPEAAAPPSLPPEEIIRRFSQKEDQYLTVRPTYGYRKTIRIDEFDREGKPIGQYSMVTEVTRASNGQVISKTVQKPQSTLRSFTLETE